MKKTLLISLAFIVATIAHARKNDLAEKLQPGLELSFKLTDNGKKVGGYSLLIYCDTNAAETLYVDKGKVMKLRLEYHHQYTLRYIKEGYRDRVVVINTYLGNGINPQTNRFDYEIGLIKEHDAPNTLADLPVAVIKYNSYSHKMDYSRKYHRQVRTKSYGRTKF